MLRHLLYALIFASLNLSGIVSAENPQVLLNSVNKDRRVVGKGLEAWSSGVTQVAAVNGKKCWTVNSGNDESRYLYVKVTDPKLKGGSMKVAVKVVALDNPGLLEISYDSYLFPWKATSVTKTGTNKWKLFTLELPDATFVNRCNGADFRLASDQAMSIARIEVVLEKRLIAPEKFERKWDLKNVPRLTADNIGFAHGAIFWGPGGMTKEIFEKELDIVKENGFGWLRYWPEWEMLEPSKGKYDWTISDYMVAEAKKRGIKQIGMVGFDTLWAADAPNSVQDWGRTKYPPKNLKDLEDYVYTLVSRYKNDVHYWEGWNEQNAINAFWMVPPSGRDPFEHYVAWQRVFYRAAKKADPNCVVLTGGFADGAELGKQLIQYYEKGLKGTFDAMNIHHYGADPREAWTPGQIETVFRIMKHYGDGDKKIWITETGWPIKNHKFQRTVEQQAQWTPWLFTVLLSYPQVERVFFFELRDVSANEYFGWYGHDFEPRPVVNRWKEFLRTIQR